MENFVLQTKDEILNSFKKVEPKYFNFLENFYEPLGKAVRTRFTYFISNAIGVEKKFSLKIACSAELVHLASLLHDDCVDDAISRRGKPTINFKYGINRAILVGDLVVSIAFNKSKSVSCDIAFGLVDCVEEMSKGALLEENLKYKLISLYDYKEVVSLKTSSIFKWISFSVGFLGKYNDFISLKKISENFGLSFQIIDDVLDVEGNEKLTGKDSFKDLYEGKINYPVLLALEDENFKSKVISFFEDRENIGLLFEIKKYLIESGYIEKARNDACKLILDLRDEVLKLKDKEKAIDFFNFMYSITERKR